VDCYTDKILRIFKTKWFDKFATKNSIDNLTLIEAVERAKNGLIDADLGCGVIKQRIAREGQGKSRGYRSIIIIKYEQIAFFVFGFPKNERGNLRQDEVEEYRELARDLLSMPERDLSQGLAEGDFVEVER
jgi:hypothetical protein